MTACFSRPAARLRLSALVALVSLAPVAALGQADDSMADGGPKTIAVAALADYNELLEDIDFLGELGGRPATKDMVEGMLAFFTGGRGLEGLDKSRPIGVVVQSDGAAFAPIGCLPVADLTPMLELAENFGYEPIAGDDGVYELELDDKTAYFQNAGAWTFVAATPEALAQAPADPSKMLQELVSTYDVGVKLMAQNVPDMYRQIALEQLRQGMEEGLVQEDNESDEDFAARRELAESQIAQLGDLIEGLDVVTLGWSIDSEKKETFLEAQLTGAEGSDIALAMSTYETPTSGVTAFHRPNAAFSLLTTGTTPPELLEKQKEQNEAAIEMARTQVEKALEEAAAEGKLPNDPEIIEAVKGATSDLLDVYADMIRNGRAEIGASLSLEGEGFDFIAGAFVSDPSKVESAFKKLAEAASKQPGFPGVEWGFASHAGVTMHGMTIPVPEQAMPARMAVGESVRVVMGVGGERVYLGVGPRCEEALKAAIDESAALAEKPIQPAEMIVSVNQVLSASEKVAPPNAAPMIGMVLDAMEQAPAGKDHFIFTTEVIDGGVKARYLLEEGVLKAIGQAIATAIAMQQQGAGAPGGGF